MTVAEIPTVDEVLAKLAEAREKIDSLDFHESYTISDYPIGGANRGQCRMWVEFSKSRGFRTARATTNKYGRWCNPKKSTYHDGYVFVVSGEACWKDAAWLHVGLGGISLQSANGDVVRLASPPCSSRPRRKDHHYSVTTRASVIDCHGLRETEGETVEHKVLPADPPELCDAWDAWGGELREALAWVKTKAKTQQN